MAKRSLHQTKRCGCCGITKPRTDFHQETYTLSGKTFLRATGTCRACIEANGLKKIEKQCIFCKQVKPANQFFQHQYTTRTGKTSIRFMSGCKACNTANRRAHRHANRELWRERYRAYRAKTWERERARRKAVRAADPEVTYRKDRAKELRHKYRMSEAEFDQLCDTQNGRCLVCQKLPSGSGTAARLAVDHCHATGKVRGLLCHNCNVALGLLKEDPQRIRALLAYIEAHSEQTKDLPFQDT